jgi:hypothetical protein
MTNNIKKVIIRISILKINIIKLIYINMLIRVIIKKQTSLINSSSAFLLIFDNKFSNIFFFTSTGMPKIKICRFFGIVLPLLASFIFSKLINSRLVSVLLTIFAFSVAFCVFLSFASSLLINVLFFVEIFFSFSFPFPLLELFIPYSNWSFLPLYFKPWIFAKAFAASLSNALLLKK